MKILWLCSTPTPEIAKATGIRSAINVSWIVNTLKSLVENSEIQIGFVFPAKVNSILEGTVDNIQYFGFPQHTTDPTIYNKKAESSFEKIIKSFKPDVIHIWGTEYPHTLAMVTASEKLGLADKTVISIQGLCSVIAKHYYAGLPNRIVTRYTIRDIIKRENIKKQKKIFEKRGCCEVKALEKAKHVIGRTDWDKACVTQKNSQINYHFCNETLRHSFYNNKWEYDKCEKYSIFVSQGYYSIKGLHFVLEAMYMLKKEYPDIKLYVGGSDMVNRGWKISSYGKYIKELMKKYDLSQNIHFTGMLDEEAMCRHYLKANVFVSAAAIENSCNSLCEAMILGVPSVSSDVGGIKSLFKHEEDGYIYPYDESYMLAYYIKQMFDNKDLAIQMGEKARKRALSAHDREKNLNTLMKIYEDVKRGE